jgi:hypothetical protein
MKVDESYPSELAGGVLLVALVAGYAVFVRGWMGLLARPTPNPRRLAFVGLAISAFMLPMLSNDVFSLFAYGSLASRGQDVYASATSLQTSIWFPWIGSHWKDVVCVYGPTTLMSLLPVGLGGGHPWIALLVLRVTWFIPLVLIMELSFRQLKNRPFFHAMVWLNPLFLLEGPGQMHADLLGVAAITAGILFQQRGRLKSGWGAFAVAALGKYTFGLTGLWFWLAGARTLRQRALRAPAIAGIFAALGVLSFSPFWRGEATITEPIRTLANMNPGGSITEALATVVYVLRGGKTAPPEMPVAQALAFDRATHGAMWLVLSLVLGIVTFRVAVHVLGAMLRNPTDDDAAALGTGVLIVAFATLAGRRFEPWYLMAALPFFGLRCTTEWRRWWVAVVALSVTPTFINLLPRTAAILPVWSVVTTTVLMITFVISFKSRYLSFGADGRESADGTLRLDVGGSFGPAID